MQLATEVSQNGQEGTITPTVKRAFEGPHHNSKRPFADVASGQPKPEGDDHPPIANLCATIIRSRRGENGPRSMGASHDLAIALPTIAEF